MPRNGSGTYSLPQAAFVPGTTISSATVNSDFSDIATALTGSVSSDGQTTITGQLKFPSGSAAAPAHTFSSDLTTGMYYPGANQLGFSAGGTAAMALNTANLGVGQSGSVLSVVGGAVVQPVGIVSPFAGSTAPTGWFLCYGQSFAAASYPELAQIIGTTYGGTAANPLVPDLRGSAPFGKDNMGGVAANRITAGVSGITGTTLGASGGAQSITILQTHLPNINFTNAGITLSDPGHFHDAQAQSGGTNPSGNPVGNYPGGSTTAWSTSHNGVMHSTGDPFIVSATTGITISSQGHAASGGSGTVLGSMPPTVILNYIIFAGRP